MQWDCFHRPLAHCKCTSQDLTLWKWPVHALNSSAYLTATSRSWATLFTLLPLKKNDRLSSLHFCYIIQSQAVMMFKHKTETFLCSDGTLKEAGANDLSLWSQRITSKKFSVLLRIGSAEISRVLFKPHNSVCGAESLYVLNLCLIKHSPLSLMKFICPIRINMVVTIIGDFVGKNWIFYFISLFALM